ncbi:MAG: MFS transporter [Clostridium butyricum]
MRIINMDNVELGLKETKTQSEAQKDNFYGPDYFAENDNKNKKMASKSAVICYGFGDLASQFIWTFVGSYLTIFYTDVVGLTPIIVSAIMLGARIWDAVNDPLMGAIAERTRTKWGRFRPYIAFGCPALALFGVMTEDADQRNKINTSRNIGMNVGMIIVNSCSAGLALYFSGSGAQVANGYGYMMVALVYSIIAVPLFFVVFFTSKEYVAPVNNIAKFSFKDTFANLVHNKYLMIVTGIMALQMTAFMGRIAVCAFYVIYCLGSFTMIAFIMTIPSIGAVIGSLFVPYLAKKMGKRNVLMYSMLIQAVGLLVIYLAPFDNMTMVIIGCCIFGLFNVGFPMTLSMVADSVDYMELKTGIRTDGTAYATYGLATKVGNALGGSVGVLLLSTFGYVANAQQTAGALRGINIVVNLIPAVLFILAAALCLLWKMTDAQADDIRIALDNKQR